MCSCRYLKLDTDHDGVISRDDLLRYGGHRLSRAIVDRILRLDIPKSVFPQLELILSISSVARIVWVAYPRKEPLLTDNDNAL